MRTLVIGGAGFIGSHLCDALLDRGDEVFCVDDFSLGIKENIVCASSNVHFHLMESDASDLERLKDIFVNVQPEYVFHLAANSDIQASAEEPAIEYKNTYTTTFNILSCMREYGVKKLFFASTSAVYGDKKGILLKEDTPDLSPVSYYGAAKLGSEALISAFSHMNDFQSLVYRFPNVIGPRLTHGVIYDFIGKLRKNPKELEILGNGTQCKPYIFVSDLIEAILFAAFGNQETVAIYNIGVEGKTTVTSIADMVCKSMKIENVKYRYTGGNIGWKGDVPSFDYDLSKIYAKGWRASHTSDESVQATLDSMRLG